MRQLEKIEEDLQNQRFCARMEGLGYKLFEKGDRHGSREVTWDKKDGALTRFVVLAATPEDLTPQYTVEVWAGADDGKGFARVLLASFEGVKPGELTNELGTRVLDALAGAASRADKMRQDHLTNRHVTTARIEEKRGLW